MYLSKEVDWDDYVGRGPPGGCLAVKRVLGYVGEEGRLLDHTEFFGTLGCWLCSGLDRLANFSSHDELVKTQVGIGSNVPVEGGGVGRDDHIRRRPLGRCLAGKRVLSNVGEGGGLLDRAELIFGTL